MEIIEKPPFFIKKITIKNLFGVKDVEWFLDEVNVLVGKNGSGKSTILKAVDFALNIPESMSENNDDLFKRIGSVRIEFNSGRHLDVFQGELESSPVNLRVALEAILNNKDFIREFGEDELRKIRDLYERSEDGADLVPDIAPKPKNSFQINSDLDEIANGVEICDIVSSEYLSTFEMSLMSQSQLDGLSETIHSHLDFLLNEEIERMRLLIIQLQSQVFNEAKGKKSVRKVLENREEKTAPIYRFSKVLNSLFEDEGKRFDIDEKGGVVLYYMDKLLPISDLSSGEKQIIIILLRALNMTPKPSILLLDEPEVSMHLSWQESLIDSIREINPKLQLIFVTHSPAIVMRGWKHAMKNIKDVIIDEGH